MVDRTICIGIFKYLMKYICSQFLWLILDGLFELNCFDVFPTEATNNVVSVFGQMR